MRCLRLAQTIRASGSGLRIASCLGGVVIAITHCAGSHLRRGGWRRSHRGRLRVCPQAENADRRADNQMSQWLFHTSPFAKNFNPGISASLPSENAEGVSDQSRNNDAASWPIIGTLADRRWPISTVVKKSLSQFDLGLPRKIQDRENKRIS